MALSAHVCRIQRSSVGLHWVSPVLSAIHPLNPIRLWGTSRSEVARSIQPAIYGTSAIHCGHLLTVLIDDGRAMLVKAEFNAELAEKDAFLSRCGAAPRLTTSASAAFRTWRGVLVVRHEIAPPFTMNISSDAAPRSWQTMTSNLSLSRLQGWWTLFTTV